MQKLTIGLPGGAWGRYDYWAVMAYMAPLTHALEQHGHNVVPLTSHAGDLCAWTEDVIGPMHGCDVIMPYSITTLVAYLAVGKHPELARKTWIGLCPIPPTGLSPRGFAWAVSNAPSAFFGAFLPHLPGVELDGSSAKRVFGAQAMATMDTDINYLHAEPLRTCLEASFPGAFGLCGKMGDIDWNRLVVPTDDGFVRIEELTCTSAHQILTPHGQHGFPVTPEGVTLICQIINEIASARATA